MSEFELCEALAEELLGNAALFWIPSFRWGMA